jgi:hypothetical protein
MPNRKYNLVILRLGLILAFVEGLAAFWSLLSVSSEEGSAFFLGYSLLRLVLLAALSAVEFMLGVLIWESSRKSDSPSIIETLFDRTTLFWILLLITGAVYFYIFASDGILGDIVSYRVRLNPILIWIGLICLQSLLVFIHLRAIGSGINQTHRAILRPTGIFLLLLAGLIAFIALTRIGLTPDALYWQGAGIPLLISQVVIASVVGLTIHNLIRRLSQPDAGRIDTIIGVSLWIAAIFLWWSQPARISYNVLEPAPPNFQSYPFGDAILYDTLAHDMLNGRALPNDFWVKPLYSVFLSFLHLFSGENYELLVLLQIVVLALIPGLVYGIVRLLGNRLAGLMAASLVILRERNAIALANVIQASHLKLLLADVFSMGLVVLSLWLMFRWFEKPERRRVEPLFIGGALGLLVLNRGHPILLLPLILFVILFFRASGNWQRWQRAGLFIAGFMLVLIPWLWRIYETTGRIALQSPVSPYIVNLAGLYSLTPNLANPEAFTTEVSSQSLEESDQQSKQVVDFILRHPGEVARFISAHYFHNVIYSYIYLPQSFRIESLRTYVTTEPFWGAWQGGLSLHAWILLFLNMTLIALGIGAAWQRHRYLALVPFLIGMGYNVSVSVGRISGWRFIQPVDWITLIYYSLGIIQVFQLMGYLLTRKDQGDFSAEQSLPSRRIMPDYVQITGYAFLFLLIGTAVTYGNKLFAGRYPDKPEGQLVDEYLSAASGLAQPYSEIELAGFLQGDRARILYGQAVYPYYLEADRGPINHAWPAYKPRPYNRLVIYLSGPVSTNVILPLPSRDFDFPDGVDVIVLGCVNDFGDVEALSVVIDGDDPALFLRVPQPAQTCPFPEPQ